MLAKALVIIRWCDYTFKCVPSASSLVFLLILHFMSSLMLTG